MNSSIDIKTLRKKASLKMPAGALQDKKTGIWDMLNRDIRFGNAVPDKIKESFYLELNSLLDAGIDIRSSIELIADNQTKLRYKKIFLQVLEWVVAGSTLSAALKNTRQFSVYEYYSIQMGEETGKLVTVLSELAVYFQKKIKQRRQIIGALTYPLIVLSVAFGAISFMITYVVPMFSDVFKRFGGDLPLATRIVVRVSTLVKGYSIPIVAFLAGMGVVVALQRKKEWFRRYSAKLVIRIPVIGGLVSKIYLSRFSHILSLLISSKIPIVQALQMSRQMVGFYPIEASLPDVEDSILKGSPLYQGLSRHAIYPKKMIALIKVGEDVNQLDKFFSRLADQYADDVEHQTNVLGKFIEPLIIVVLGLVVGIILIAMYLPLFKLGQAF